MRNGDGDAVVARAFRLLAAFQPDRADLSLDQISQVSGLARSTAHRLAVQLAEQGALERSRRGWRLGVRLFELGQIVPRQQRLRDLALAHMEDLYEATHETVHLAVLEGSEVLYVEIISGHRKVRTPSRRGGRLLAHCTGVGKALMAFSDDASAILGAAPLARMTPHTITDPKRLIGELRDVRRSGLAYDHQEAWPGLVCVAAPVLAPDGTAHAALSISMPAGGKLTQAQAAPALRTAARALSRELQPWHPTRAR